MRVRYSGVRLQNFKSFEDSGETTLRPGLNVIVGRNNVGKTALLESLHLLNFNNFTGRGNDRLDLARRNNTGNPSLDVVLEVSDQASDMVVSFRGHEYFPSRYRFQFEKRSDSVFGVKAIHVPHVTNDEWLPLATADSGYNYYGIGIPELRPRKSLGDHLGSILTAVRDSTFFLGPHRVTPAAAALATGTNLEATAQNFHEVFLTTCNNRPDVRHSVQAFIQSVFDEVDSVLSKVLPGNQTAVHVRLRTAPMDIPLSECGTGLEQLLIVSFLVMSANQPLILLWDEPHAFLHPGAERALIDLMNGYPEHQYLVSTHSSVFINAARPEGIVLISRSDGKSTSASLKDHQQGGLETILREIGASNAELFLSDRLIFVEGPSDGPILRHLLTRIGYDCSGVTFPVLGGEGKLQSPKWRDALIESYDQLIGGITELPVPCFFLLDRRGPENATREADLERRYGRKIRFLKRREIENYLLDSEAIFGLIQEKARLYNHQVHSVDQHLITDRLSRVTAEQKGSQVLEEIFASAGLTYEKTKDGPNLAQRIILLDEVVSELRGVFEGILPNSFRRTMRALPR